MRTLLFATFLVLLLGAAQGSTVIDAIFEVIEEAIAPLQDKPLNDATGCYIQWKSLHKCIRDLVSEIINGEKIGVIISNIIDAIKNLIYINECCVFHDMDDDLQHFAKHPGDVIGRLIWNYQATILFFKNLIYGIRWGDYGSIGFGLGKLIFVIFDGKIL